MFYLPCSLLNRGVWEKPAGFSYWHLALYLLSFSTSAIALETSVDDFLQNHWQRPLATQGDTPLNLSTIETRLNPKSCGSCHRRQLSDWGNSLHSKAMKSGLIGQLLDMPADDLRQHQACIRCHAPLNEQAIDLQNYLKDPDNTGLEQHGVVCAACHIRNYQWFGPPPLKPINEKKRATLPHNGFQTHTAFQDSKFCAACHQFKDDEYALNGKLLENTYKEWQASTYADKNIHCQNCHMPKRKHLWLGIHDKKTTLSGIKIITAVVKSKKQQINTEFRVKNIAVGHAFPTYLTPKITMQVVQLDKKGQPLADSLQQKYIMRDVNLSLTKELSDTRLLPEQSIRLDYQMKKHPKATQLQFKIVVAPDYFYARFYRAILKAGTVKKGKAHIEKALSDAESSVYTLYEKTVALP